MISNPEDLDTVLNSPSLFANNEPVDYTNDGLSPTTFKNQEVGAGDTKVMDTNQQRQIMKMRNM